MEKQPRIIVVEDEPGIADTIEYALKTEGFAVERANTGGAGLELLKSPAALLVLDVGLPDINGFDVCRKLRTFSNIPVIFLTARNDDIDRIVGLEIGADDYLTKPFHPRELVARVRAVLRRTTREDAHVPGTGAVDAADAAGPATGPFIVDQERNQISYFGKVIVLSRYEFKMLSVLISRPGWVFSREKLMNLVWDEPDSSLERTIDTHIKTVRARLREIRPDIEPIVTHRGVGYSLREEW